MDFAALQVFKTVVEEGGISPAARRLHRVQSNVTTRIQQLEASLGAKLFVREGRRLFLSPAGELFLGYVNQLLKISELARSAVLGDAPRGVLRIGTLESTAASRLPSVLSRYHEKHPAVRVELVTGTTDALVEAVLRRKLEAAFVAEFAAVPNLEATDVFSEELVVIAPRSHPRIRRAQDACADMVIAFPAGCAYRRRFQAWLAAGGIAPEKVLELSSYHAIVACVASGTGIAFVPRSVLETIRTMKGAVVYPIASNKQRITTSLVWRRGETSSALRALQAGIGNRRATGKTVELESA